LPRGDRPRAQRASGAPRDPEALAAAVRSLLDDPDPRATHAAEACRDPVERLDLDRINEHGVELYRRSLHM
jgi:hypothetical protein